MDLVIMNRRIKSISPDPVASAVVELRFESEYPKAAIFGLAFSKLKSKYSNPFSLPIMQLPEEIRLKDPNLKFKPWYQLSKDKILLQIGPDVIAVNCECSSGYMGWMEFSSLLNEINQSVIESGVIKAITRIGIRFISFFVQTNIFDNLQLKIQRDGHEFTNNPTIFVTQLHDNNFIQRLEINNEVFINSSNAPGIKGSTVDIDTFTNERMTEFENLGCIINKGHDLEKSLFFSLLQDKFLESLNPIYEKDGE